MPKLKTWVVKIGGAMMHAPELPRWLSACFAGTGGIACVVIAGGGALADQVRALHGCWRFEERLGHDLALEAMRMNASVLAALAPRARVCSGARSVARGLAAGADLLWRPPRPFAAPDLPPSWQATSDSIALWLAQELSADALVLVKSVGRETLGDGTAAAFSDAGVIDRHFPLLFARRPLSVRLVAKSDDAPFSAGRLAATAASFGCAAN